MIKLITIEDEINKTLYYGKMHNLTPHTIVLSISDYYVLENILIQRGEDYLSWVEDPDPEKYYQCKYKDINVTCGQLWDEYLHRLNIEKGFYIFWEGENHNDFSPSTD